MSKKQEVVSISFPRMVIHVGLVGNNSLLGALCREFIAKNYMKHLGLLNPTEIVFVIKKVQPDVNLYAEINLVRDILKIDEKEITVFILS